MTLFGMNGRPRPEDGVDDDALSLPIIDDIDGACDAI
jgi:hypothetical protein